MLQLTKTEQRRLAHPSKLLEDQTQGQEFKSLKTFSHENKDKTYKNERQIVEISANLF